jgi:hypothetical protein
MYRHALPPGFVLKSQKKALDEAAKANTISLEEFLEVEVRSDPIPFIVFKRCSVDANLVHFHLVSRSATS